MTSRTFLSLPFYRCNKSRLIGIIVDAYLPILTSLWEMKIHLIRLLSNLLCSQTLLYNLDLVQQILIHHYDLILSIILSDADLPVEEEIIAELQPDQFQCLSHFNVHGSRGTRL